METIKLNNDIEMPLVGYGVFQVNPEETARCVSDAISVGYRLIDTAQAYYNEEGVSEGIARSGVNRSDLFLTTKVWITNAGEEKAAATRACASCVPTTSTCYSSISRSTIIMVPTVRWNVR